MMSDIIYLIIFVIIIPLNIYGYFCWGRQKINILGAVCGLLGLISMCIKICC